MVSPQFKLTVYTSTGTATKTITMENGALISDRRPELYRGLANVKTLTLKTLPEVINNLTHHQAVGCGIPTAHTDIFRLSTRKHLEEFNTTVLHDETGWTMARLAENFHHDPECSLMVFDYDPSESMKLTFNTPQEFADWLGEVCPAFKDAAYVAKYSTSSNIYYQGHLIKPVAGFHLYFAVKLGNKTQLDIATHIQQQAWLRNEGYILVSKSGALLPRVPIDTSVAQTNRIMYEAPAVLATEGLTQDNQAWYADGLPLVDLSKIAKPGSNSKQREVQAQVERAIIEAKNQPEILAQLDDIKRSKVQELMKSGNYSRIQAESAFEMQTQGILDKSHILYFDDGREVPVGEVLIDPMSYHQATLADPLEPTKGANKAQFFANDLGANPVIHTFVRGEGNYYLNESWLVSSKVIESDQSKAFQDMLDCDVYEQGHTHETRWFDAPIPNTKFICLIGDQGTGKTEQVARWQSEGKLGTILSVAPRIALVLATAARLGISSYSDDEVAGSTAMLASGLSTTLDSIPKFEHYNVDTLFLDEFEQLVTHLKAETLKHKRLVLHTLKVLCHRAKRIILADADLSSTTIKLLQQLGILPLDRLTIFLNHFKACAGGVVELVNQEWLVLNEILKTVKNGEGCYIASNKKGVLHIIIRLLINKIGALDSKYTYRNGDFLIPLANGQRIVIVSKDNSGTEEVGNFTRDINKNLRDNDILLTSPSISTGVSINVVNGLPKLKNRFLLLSAMVGTTTSDAIQHLERIRGGAHCRNVIYAQEAKLSLDVNEARIVTQEIFGAMLEIYRANDICGSDQNLYCRIEQIDNDLDKLYSTIYGYITAKINLDRNNYAYNLRQRLCVKGYTVKDLTPDVDLKVRDAVGEAREEQRQYLKDLAVEAPLLDEDAEKTLRKKQHHTIEEAAMLNKTSLAKLLGVTRQDTMNEIMEMEKSKIRALEDVMLLALTNRRAIQLELSSIARQNGTPTSTRTFLERKFESLELLKLIGIYQAPNGLLESDGRVIKAEDLVTVYRYLKEIDYDEDRPGYSRVKSLFGIKMVGNLQDSEVREIGKLVSNIFRKIGIFFKRSTIRNPEDMRKTLHVRYVDVDWLGIIRARMSHAMNFSKHDWFASEITAPAELMQLRMDKLLGIPSQTTLASVCDSLLGEYAETMQEFLDTGKFEINPVTNDILAA